MLNINLEKISELDFMTREAYKTLRTNVQFCGNDVKVVAITSSAPNEGKSTVTFNLAVSMAESGKKVLFIDGDLRKSVLIGRYKINKAIKGLTQYLSGSEELDSVIYDTNVENMDMIISGPVPPNPAELLSGEKFSKLIEEVRDKYDFVIIDTPPIGRVIDAAIIASRADGVLFIVSQGSISYKYAQKQIEQLRKSGCRILGAIINKVDPNGGYKKYRGRKNDYYNYESSSRGKSKK